MATFKRPTFDEAPASSAEPTAEKVIEAPAGAGPVFKRPVFEEPKTAAPAKAPSKPFSEMGLGDVHELINHQFNQSPEEASGQGKAMFNGLLFGLGDRARALTGLGVEGANYDERLNKVLAEREAYNKENPISHYITEGVPGLVSGAGLVSGGKAALGKIAPGLMEYAAGSGLAPAAVRQAGNLGTAAAFGAAGGAGSAKPGEVPQGAASGALMGMGTTLALQGAGKVAGAGIGLMTPMLQKAAIMLGVKDPGKWAEKKLVEDLLEQGHSVESVVGKMKDMANKGAWTPQKPDFVGPPMEVPAKPVVLADALPAKTLGMLKKAGTDKGGGAEIIAGKLGQRAVEAPDRIANDIATNISERTGASGELARIIEDRAVRSKPLYDSALAHGTPQADDIVPFFNNNMRKSLFNDVQNNRLDQGKPFQGRMTVDPKTQEFKIVETPSIGDLHEMRKRLSEVKQSLWDDEAGKYKGWGKIGRSKFNAAEIDEQLGALTKQIEKLTPDGKGGSYYAEARKIFSDESSVAEALHKGTNIIRTRPEDVAIEFGKLKSEAERDAYRSGISSVLTDKTGSTSSGATILKGIFGNKNIRDKLDQVYPNDGARALFPKQMAAEQKMQDTTKILAPKVQSHDFLESGGDASLPAALANFAAGRTVAGSANMARFIAGQADRMTPQYGEQFARLGMMDLPAAESFAADIARRTNSPLAQAGRAIKSGTKALGRQVPYEGGNLLSREDETGALERLKRAK